MPFKCEQVNETRLRPASSQEEYDLHLAALDWSLADPIIIESAEDIKSTPTWRERLEPFDHQIQNLFTFCRRLPVMLMADDVGLGKTISAGLVMSELMMRRRVQRVLVICPKILAEQWVEELDSKFAITAKVAVGAKLAEEIKRQTPVVVTTYDSARNKLDAMDSGAFDMVILDEAHKLRNLYGTPTAPRLAVRIREALEKRLFKFVLMLTATPLQNRLWDLYSLIDCLTVARGHQNPLGTPDAFRARFIRPGTDGRKLQPERVTEFRDILQQYLVRTRRSDAGLKFPARQVRTVPVAATPGELALRKLVVECVRSLNPLQQTSVLQALASSPQALATQMENMAAKGSVKPHVAAAARAEAKRIHTPAKLGGLLRLLADLRAERPRDWRAVVFTRRIETQQAIGDALQAQGVKFGFVQGGEDSRNWQAIQQFRANPPGVNVIVSTDAGAEGINLQVANVLVNYDLPWNPMVVEQRIGRIQRLASAHEFVSICNLVIADSFEERIVVRLMERLQLIAQAIGDIEAILEVVADGEDEEESFEAKIRDLVLKSLLGQDVAAATNLVRESIARAREHLEEQREELDATLGRLDALHHTGPAMPKLARKPPAIDAKEFVLRAKRATGATVRHIAGETYEVDAPGKPVETITFHEAAASDNGQAVFMGNSPKLYLPGKPAFERLVQYWVDHYAQLVWDLRPQSAVLADKLARQWCATVPDAQFQRADFEPTGTGFHGIVVLKAKAGNAVDSYEKTIRGRIAPAGHESAFPVAADTLVRRDVLPTEMFPNIKQAVARVVEADGDLGRFHSFYEARRDEETGKAGQDPRKLRKITADFTAQVFAEIGAVRGTQYEVGRLTVRFTLDGAPHAVTIDALPGAGQVLGEPARRPCARTRRVVPDTCLARCAVSGTEVLSHLLVASEETGRQALPEHSFQCPVSNRRVLEDEVGQSAISGQPAALSQLKQSPVSGRMGLAAEFGKCQITGAEVLTDELVQSQVSGWLFRADEQVVSAVSGTVGHRSEMVLCERTRQTVLPAEAARSAVSGKLVRADLLFPSEKSPGRLGLRNELVQCVGGKWLLIDEAARSAASGKWCDRDLLSPSARSGQLALRSELITCEESRALLLPSETGVCALTGRRVDARHLASSEASGQTALSRLLTRCARTGKRVLPAELAACELTGNRVLPTELEVCAVTGRRVRRDCLLRSVVSAQPVLPDYAVRSALSNQVCLPAEAVQCAWLEGPILPSEAGVCRLSGCTVAWSFLNERGELRPLRDLLDGTHEKPNDADDLLLWIRARANGELGGLKRAWCVASPRGGVVAVCAEARTLLGFRVRHAGFVVRVRGERQLVSRSLLGKRGPNGWQEEFA